MQDSEQLPTQQSDSLPLEATQSGEKKTSIFRIPFTAKPAAETPAGTIETATDTPADIQRRGKMLGSGLKHFVSLVDRTTVKLLARRLRKAGVEKSRATEIAEVAHLSEDSLDTIKECGGRIAARRVKNEEAGDFIAVTGALGEWIAGIVDVLSEIKSLQEQNEQARK